jgi:membrane protein DedA with SNARE-associated domain
MKELAEQLVRFGLPFVFANVFLEQAGLPIPAVPTLVVAGALAADGRLPGLALVAGALAACILADFLWYRLGRVHGHRILRILCRISLSPDSCVRQTETLFERYGVRSLLFAKFVPGLSTVAPPLAGAIGARTGQFLLYDGGGAVLWAGSALAAGALFHGAIDRVLAFLAGMGFWALVALGAGLALFIALKWWERRRLYKVLRLARITAEELHRLMGEGKDPIVADVRSRGAFRADPRRIPGAIRLELEELDEKLADLPRDRDIVLYCT